ncbi:MAG TPA: rhomboid family intramembrane serine protease, partial [Kineosporiaceae bacterium]
PRHPGEVSYVRCQRCERPVCPACQRPAAVGVQCVDCVRADARSGRVTRTVFGARAGTGRPLVTQAIIAACVIVYLFQWGDQRVTTQLSFVPVEAVAEPYRFITAAFLHSPSFVLHIVMNMYALWVLGPYLESLLGRARFAALYALSAVGGSVGYLVLSTPGEAGNWVTPAVGASGAVFGLFSAILVINRRLGRDVSGVVGVILINLVIGFLPSLDIAWQAHLGGLVTGAVVSLVLAAPATAGRGPRQLAGMVGVAVLLVGLTVMKILTVPAGLLA